MPGTIQWFLKALVDLVYPLRCASCRRKIPSSDGLPLCPGCSAAIVRNRPPFCRACGRTISRESFKNGLCENCGIERPLFDRAYGVFLYDGPVKTLIHELKYRGKEHLGKLLGECIAGFTREYSIPLDFVDYIVPIPLHPVKLREREFNQALLLAGPVSRAINRPIAASLLSRRRNTRTQTELSHDERLRNVAGSFEAKADLRGKNILLVDDVMTTGATCSAAALALKRAGAARVIVITLAT